MLSVVAYIFIALYLLIGARSVIWYGTYLRLREKGWGPVGALLLCVFDLTLWPINAIDRHRQGAQ